MPLIISRVLARDGQQQRRPEGVLGHLLLGHQRAGRVRLGLGGPGHPPAGPRPRCAPTATRASTFFAYGGYWEDRAGVRNDGNFCQNGLVAADRRPHPGLRAIKYVYRYLHAAPVDLAAGTISVKSWFDEINPKDLVEGRWDILANGRVVASGPMPEIDLAPRQQKTLQLGAAGAAAPSRASSTSSTSASR